MDAKRIVTAPLRLNWTSPGRTWDLSRPEDEASWYELLLREGNAADIAGIPFDRLRELSSLMTLPYAAEVILRKMEERELSVPSGVLTPLQAQVLEVLGGGGLAERLRLAGGTALAAGYFGHRLSEDLDFFPLEETVGPLAEAMAAQLRESGMTVGLDPGHAFTRTFRRFYVNEELKVEVAWNGKFRIAPSSRRLNGILLESLEDLAADKTLALWDRAAPRDLVDVWFLAEHYGGAPRLMAWAAAKDPGFDPYTFARSLARARRADFRQVRFLKSFEREKCVAWCETEAARIVEDLERRK
ncbi:MAG: nucleotidyl transferase AbiEii/AbiGii toxin family protein [Thermaerobacter sp.]|jgi:hypothetical protein|nr:nucleotidyl transferase AbiEii/AbiGii toxin family protein [Thermaerobacter sp.]